MTVADPTPLVCPECGAVDTMVGAAGNGLCFGCNHTWDPLQVVAMPRPLTTADVDADTGRELAAYIDEMEGVALGLEAELIGGTARLEGGQVGTVVGFPDDDHVEVELRDGRHELVDYADVSSITPPALIGTPAADTVADADQLAFGESVMLTASLIVKAAVASVRVEGDVWHVDATPEDFLPTDPAMFPIVEQAAVMACVSLITMFHIDPGLIVTALDAAIETNIEGDQTGGTE